MSSRVNRCASPLLLLALLALALPGQALPGSTYWAAIPAPPNLLSLSQFGTTLLMRTTTSVDLFSSIKMEWTSIPVSPTALTYNFNDYVIIRDGGTFYGYTSREGVFVLNVAPTAVLTNGPTSSSWLSVVQDGTTLWGFASFAPQWVPQTIATATPQILAGSHALLANDGVSVHAFSSYYGIWQPLPASAGMSLFASGTLALATTPSSINAFSAYRNAWTSQAFASSAAPFISDSYSVIAGGSGTQVLAYSSVRGTFATVLVSPSYLQTTGSNVAVIKDGANVLCYGPGLGTWASMTAPGATITIPGEYALIDTGVSLVAFSGLNSAFAPPLLGTFTLSTNLDAAFAQGATSYGYSVTRNAWTAAPAVAIQSIQMVRNAAIIVRANGYEAFSARTGQWYPLNTAATATFNTLPSGATFAARDGNVINVFDSRLGRWLPVTTASAAPTISIWRTTLVASDAIAAYGFGQYNSVWDVIPIIGTVITTSANDAVAYVRTSQFIYTYSGMGSLSMLSRYPEFSRFQPTGTPFRISQFARPGSQVTTVLAAAAAPAVTSFPGWGSIYLDVTQIILALPIGSVPAGGLLSVEFALPDDPALNGFTLHVQDIVSEPNGNAFFSNSISPILL